MKVSFVRHGQTDLNKQMRMQGRINMHMNEEGIKQAERLRDQLKESGTKFDLIYSSPLIRAVETARIATGSDDIITDDRLLEIDYGPYDGEVFYDLPENIKNFLRHPETEPVPEGIESFEHMMERTGSFLRDLEKKDRNLSILVVAHGIMMFSIWGHIVGDGIHAYRGTQMDNCEIRTAEYTDGKWKMI